MLRLLTLLAITTTYCLRALAACVNSPENRQCWGEFDINTDYNVVVPDTGTTVEVNKHCLI